MREIMMDWMKNLALFSLLSSVCIKLLPGKQYAPYVRLFSGFVLLLLFLNPLLTFFDMEKDIAKEMEKKNFEIEISLMETELLKIEEEQKKKLEEELKKSLEMLEKEEQDE